MEFFTVKSAYWLGMRGRIGQQGDLWRQIWTLNAPPKLCHFAWRACNNTLAVRAYLWRRHIIDDASCAVCGAAIEDVVHALLECNTIQEVWNGFKYMDIINNAIGNDGQRNLDTILQLFDAQEKCDFLVRAWATWIVRNSHYFEESPALPLQVVVGFLRLVDDYRTYA
ncbi:uncharacterized protein LOC141594893 [Silene latifolia]|uniref:uncharacterized protein LOC141594893 n=1 Tax=Silene latifolia TaxID=37657 RepID=UPI003D783047